MSYQLAIKDVEIKYGQLSAVKKISLSLERGEIGCLLGPSGCGKTSLQRAIAGFEPLSRGQISLAGKVVSKPGSILSPERRNVGMVFQDYALFPHLNVERNITFGLSKLSKSERHKRVQSLLEM
ncbi:MAG: iron ABC transporter ATP-binding protein, partial [Alteromonadaceae bacterium]